MADLFPDASLIEPTGESGIARLTDSFHLNLTAFGLLAFAVGLFIVHAAIGLAFEQRRALFRTLRALGLPLGVLMGCLAAELVVLTLLGGGLGVALGYVVAAALLPGVAATLSGLYGAGVSGALTLSPVWWLSGSGHGRAGTGGGGGTKPVVAGAPADPCPRPTPRLGHGTRGHPAPPSGRRSGAVGVGGGPGGGGVRSVGRVRVAWPRCC